jgi:hypothetical protein
MGNKVGYAYTLYQNLGSSRMTTQLICLLFYYQAKVRAKELGTDWEMVDWGEGIKEYTFLINKFDVMKFPSFKHLWGHKIRLYLETDQHILVDHEFVEANWSE